MIFMYLFLGTRPVFILYFIKAFLCLLLPPPIFFYSSDVPPIVPGDTASTPSGRPNQGHRSPTESPTGQARSRGGEGGLEALPHGPGLMVSPPVRLEAHRFDDRVFFLQLVEQS